MRLARADGAVDVNAAGRRRRSEQRRQGRTEPENERRGVVIGPPWPQEGTIGGAEMDRRDYVRVRVREGGVEGVELGGESDLPGIMTEVAGPHLILVGRRYRTGAC